MVECNIGGHGVNYWSGVLDMDYHAHKIIAGYHQD